MKQLSFNLATVSASRAVYFSWSQSGRHFKELKGKGASALFSILYSSITFLQKDVN